MKLLFDMPANGLNSSVANIFWIGRPQPVKQALAASTTEKQRKLRDLNTIPPRGCCRQPLQPNEKKNAVQHKAHAWRQVQIRVGTGDLSSTGEAKNDCTWPSRCPSCHIDSFPSRFAHGQALLHFSSSPASRALRRQGEGRSPATTLAECGVAVPTSSDFRVPVGSRAAWTFWWSSIGRTHARHVPPPGRHMPPSILVAVLRSGRTGGTRLPRGASSLLIDRTQARTPRSERRCRATRAADLVEDQCGGWDGIKANIGWWLRWFEMRGYCLAESRDFILRCDFGLLETSIVLWL